MFADGRTVPAGEAVRTHVCVVGAGPAGITVAKRLADAGVEVVLIERGAGAGTGKREDLGNSVNVGIPYVVDKARGTGFGGALNKWLTQTPLGDGFGRLREYAADDFLERSWIPDSGWPFAKDHLAPYYRRARRWFDVDWPSEDPYEDWDAQLAVTPICASEKEPIRSHVYAFAEPGFLASDCRRALDSSEKVLALTHSTAISLVTDPGGSSISAVEVATDSGRFRVVSSLVVLAAGALENARLLLVSRDVHEKGVGNPNDVVGRYFMEHPRFTSGFVVPSDLLRSDESIWDIHMRDGVPVQRKFRFSPEFCARASLPNSIFFFRRKAWTPDFEAAQRAVRDYRAITAAREFVTYLPNRRLPSRPLRRVRDLAVAPHAIVRAAKQHKDHPTMEREGRTTSDLLTIEVMAEQVPNPASRIRLHRRRDRFGVPKAAVEWRLSDFDLGAAARAQTIFEGILVGKGLGEVYSLLREDEIPPHIHSADHHMGTTRMHRDPRRGVVDVNCAVHGVANLYIGGPSVFPTGGEANPTLTIVAMSLRLSDHIIARLDG